MQWFRGWSSRGSVSCLPLPRFVFTRILVCDMIFVPKLTPSGIKQRPRLKLGLRPEGAERCFCLLLAAPAARAWCGSSCRQLLQLLRTAVLGWAGLLRRPRCSSLELVRLSCCVSCADPRYGMRKEKPLTGQFQFLASPPPPFIPLI